MLARFLHAIELDPRDELISREIKETALRGVSTAIGLMALVTALSRLTLFLGVKAMGSIQTALLGVFEVVVTIVIAAVFLDERLTMLQWLGAAVLIVSIFLVRFEKGVPRFVDWWQFLWRNLLPRK